MAISFSSGESLQAVPWFLESQTTSHLEYVPEVHGTVCEWLADIIAVPIEKAERTCGSRSLHREVIQDETQMLKVGRAHCTCDGLLHIAGHSLDGEKAQGGSPEM